MATSRKLKIYRNTDSTDYFSKLNDNFELSLSRNNEKVKIQKGCSIPVPSEKPICEILDTSNLTLNRKVEVEQSVPKIDLSSILKKCEENRVFMFDFKKNKPPSTLTHKKHKIGFTDLSIDILKILNDTKDLLKKERHKNCFGQVTYNNKKINFYSENDIKKLLVLGTVDLSETVEEVENKIPIIFINNDTLEIEQEI